MMSRNNIVIIGLLGFGLCWLIGCQTRQIHEEETPPPVSLRELSVKPHHITVRSVQPPSVSSTHSTPLSRPTPSPTPTPQPCGGDVQGTIQRAIGLWQTYYHLKETSPNDTIAQDLIFQEIQAIEDCYAAWYDAGIIQHPPQKSYISRIVQDAASASSGSSSPSPLSPPTQPKVPDNSDIPEPKPASTKTQPKSPANPASSDEPVLAAPKTQPKSPANPAPSDVPAPAAPRTQPKSPGS